jgi:predicted dehydrogenase
MNRIRFGITGSGFMGRTHAEAIKRLEADAALVAIWGGSRAPALAKRYGAASEPTLEALMRRPDIDAVVLTTPHHLHAREALLAMESGKHVLIEKPIATTVEDADQLLQAARKNRVVLGSGYHQRFRINNIRARQVIGAGAIGRVLTTQVSMPMYIQAAKSQFGGNWDWWNLPESIGHLLNAAPHAIDLMRWFTGAEVANVSAFCRTFAPGQAVEDTTMAMMELSDGTLFSFFSSNALPAPAFPGEDFRFRIMGTAGLIELPPVGEMKVADEKGWRVESNQIATNYTSAEMAFADTRMQCYCDQMSAFLEGIRGQELRCGSGNDGRAGVAVCQAMLESSRERRWVAL